MMGVRWSHILTTVAGAAAAAALAPVSFWDASKAPLLTALSVIAAGVLVRLARGLPFTNPEQFELEEARQIAEAIKRSVRTLRTLLVVAFLAMGSLVFARPIASALKPIADNLYPIAGPYVEPAVSGLVGLLLSYVFVRIFAVIMGDIGLVDLQSKLLVQSVERKQAERFGKAVEKLDAPAFKNPEGYGKIVQ